MAALAVALFHARGWLPGAGAWPIDERFSMLGVAVFFAISGMLMAEIVPRTDPWRFLSHRVVRIYPLYLFLVATWAVIAPVLGAQRVGFHLLSLTLAPVGGAFTISGLNGFLFMSARITWPSSRWRGPDCNGIWSR